MAAGEADTHSRAEEQLKTYGWIVSSVRVDSERSEAWVPKLEVPIKFSGLE